MAGGLLLRGGTGVNRENHFGISAAGLKIMAMLFMFCDHAWATIIPANNWLTMIGRLAFPIFAFQVAEGFALTRDRKKYTRRLLIFALITEIPFNLMTGGGPIYPFHQNVMFTFWLSLLVLNWIERGRAEGLGRYILAILSWGLVGFLAGTILMVDYYGYGVLTVILFYLTRDIRPALRRTLQLGGMYLINWVLLEGWYIPLTLFGFEINPPMQALAILALIPIWLYNGQKGRGYDLIKPMCYWFYPVHILFLSLLGMYVV
jgi:hypothetical protein